MRHWEAPNWQILPPWRNNFLKTTLHRAWKKDSLPQMCVRKGKLAAQWALRKLFCIESGKINERVAVRERWRGSSGKWQRKQPKWRGRGRSSWNDVMSESCMMWGGEEWATCIYHGEKGSGLHGAAGSAGGGTGQRNGERGLKKEKLRMDKTMERGCGKTTLTCPQLNAG